MKGLSERIAPQSRLAGVDENIPPAEDAPVAARFELHAFVLALAKEASLPLHDHLSFLSTSGKMRCSG